MRLIFAAACLVAGCASAARYMTEVKPSQRIMAPPDQSVIVFVRPSKMAFAVSANILDENGRFLGDIPAKGHFATALPPGRHTLTVWAENTDALTAELAPGRIYFVEVYPTMGAWSAHMHLRAVKPSMASWHEKDQWMRFTTQFAVDQSAGQANLERKGRAAVEERLRRGLEHLAKYQGLEHDERSLAAGDGL